MTHHADATPATGRRDGFDPARLRGFVRPRTAVAALAVAALMLAACGSSSPSSATTTPAPAANSGSGATTAPSTAAPATVKTDNSSQFGTILVNSAGMALYTYAPNNSGTVNMCSGACLQAWPALTVPAGTTPMLAAGVTGTLATAKQADGTLQVTYNGQLLYTFVSDTSPGQVTGNGVAKFSVAKVSSGSAASAGNTPATTKAPTTTAASGGGNGY
jgi:predicted lipoprotein with Yx(FWY)xxD motif